MLIHFFRKNSVSQKFFYHQLVKRKNDLLKIVTPHLRKDDRMLDIGSGNCVLLEDLLNKQYDITGLDIEDSSFVPNLSPTIYDGENMPFKDNQFDTSLLLFVLHHTQNPEQVLSEAARVSKRIIIMEDIYLNRIHKQLTSWMDNVLNLEFFGNPHNNKTDEQWKDYFKSQGFKLKTTKHHHSFLILRHATYVLEV